MFVVKQRALVGALIIFKIIVLQGLIAKATAICSDGTDSVRIYC